ncbi:MAG: phosphomannose isomerase type II C-terminal cupin domain [Candidatus Omnitrophica bacterium]|nr:phosphomannose isomerase type II C-terminal cupin domain [Candidatus Omnitrophota bacterium]
MNALSDARPWGRWEILATGRGWQVKRLTVKSGKRLSLQFHRHRSEYWVVVAGQGLLTLGKRTIRIARGSTAHIPIGMVHRVQNTGRELLQIIEVQMGRRIAERDIVRLADDFGRV